MAERLKINFSLSIENAFDGKQADLDNFRKLLFDTSYDKNEANFSTETSNKVIRDKFLQVMELDENYSKKEFRRAFQKHRLDIFAIIEEVIEDRLVSGWGNDPFYEAFVESRNIGLGDKNEFTVADTSLLSVSKFAGNHHDIIRQKVGPSKAFQVDTSWYAIKVYADYESYMAGRIDFTALVDKLYKSVEKYRKDALYAAFMSADKYLPTDMVKELQIIDTNKDKIIEMAEEVSAATGCPVAFVGTKVALSKLQALTPTGLWSNEMKNEKYNSGMLGKFEGYDLITIPRVNEFGTRKEITDNKKIMIIPVDPDFKPIKHVSENDGTMYEFGMSGEKMDMTVENEYHFKEGIAVVINQLYGEIKIQDA